MPSICKNRRVPWVTRSVLCMLSLFSLCIPMNTNGAPPLTATLPDTAIWVLGLFGLWVLYGMWLKLENPFAEARLWVLAVFLACIVTLGRSFAVMGTAEMVTANKLRSLVFLVGRVPLYYAAMRLLCSMLQSKGKPLVQRHTTLFFTIGLLLCWLPYWVLTFPGTVSNDSISQLKEIFGVVPMSNANPVFQTWLIVFFEQLGRWLGSADGAVALYCGAQALLLAWLLGSLLRAMGQSGAPKWLSVGTFAFYALCPIFPLFAFCIGKDTNFAMAVLFLSLTVERFVQSKAQGSRLDAICLCAASILCMLLRNPGIYLAILSLVLLLVWTLKRSQRVRGLWRMPVLAIVTTLCVYGALHLWVLPTLSIAPMPETESYSLPLQQVARVVAGGELNAAEATAIDGVLELSKVTAAYNGELSDPVKLLWRTSATAAQKQAFWKTWASLLCKHPATCLSATFHNTYGYLYPGYMSTIKPTLLIGKQGRTTDIDAFFNFTVNPHCEKLQAFTAHLAQNPLYRVLISPGLYGWSTLFAFVFLLKGGRRKGLLSAVPSLFTLAGCMLSAVNGYFRYAMPLYLCAPLLLWLCTRSPQNAQRSVRT